MKKKLLLFVPLIALSSCAENPEAFLPYLDYTDGIPTVHLYEGGHTTYLMLSQFGYLDFSGAPVKGDVNEKFYQNTVIWVAEAGTDLPSGSDVKSEVNGATFRGWAYYNEDNENVYPDYYTTVPSQDGLALKAIFDGTDAGGGGGGEITEGYGIKFSDGTIVQGTAKGMSQYGKDEYLCASLSFTVGQVFQLYNYSTKVAWSANCTVNTYSFGGQGDDTWKSYISSGANGWTVRQNFTADVYLQFAFENDSIYFELK